MLTYTDKLVIEQSSKQRVEQILNEPPRFHEVYPASIFYEYFGSVPGYDEDEMFLRQLDTHDQIIYKLQRIWSIRGFETNAHFKRLIDRLLSNPLEIPYGARTGKVDFAARKQDLGTYAFEVHDRGEMLSAISKLVEALSTYNAVPYLVTMTDEQKKEAATTRDASRVAQARAIRLLTRDEVDLLYEESKSFEDLRKRFNAAKVRFDQLMRGIEL